ncbi:hypothetical protein KVD83_00905 [Helicobacter pylori]|nr:hypothetical protein KVD83_00905 [Helicobacter pylori]
MKKIIRRSKTWLLDRFSSVLSASKISKKPFSSNTVLVQTFGLKFLLACL